MRGFLKYFLTFLLGLLIGTVGLVAIFFFAVASVENPTEEIEVQENSVISLKLPVVIEDRVEEDDISKVFNLLSNTSNLGLNELTSLFNRASEDKNIKGIYLDAGLYAGGYATAKEIRNLIHDFRKTDKFIYSYSENYTEQGYYIASACDSIFLNPNGMCELNGLGAGITMYKGLFDQVGLEMQVFKAGKFKGAVEPFVNSKLSEENKFQIQTYLNSLHQIQKSEIQKDRDISMLQLDSFIALNDGFEAVKCRDAKIVDDLIYWDQFHPKVATNKTNWIKAKNYLNTASKYEYSENRIAVLYLSGDIISGTSEDGKQIASNDVLRELKSIRKDKKIKALILRINSPGGSSAASDVIAREIELTKKQMPVYASYGNVAASGGYYISCLADSIFASKNTITGSIGVFAMIPNTQKLYKEKLGLGYESINTHDNATLWRPDAPLTAFQQQKIQKMINKVYGDFTGIVSRGRNIPLEKVKELAEGRVYSGIDAKKVGLVDAFGGFTDVIKYVENSRNLKGSRIVSYPKASSPFESLLKKIKGESPLSKELKSNKMTNEILESVEVLETFVGPQMRLPWSTSIH